MPKKAGSRKTSTSKKSKSAKKKTTKKKTTTARSSAGKSARAANRTTDKGQRTTQRATSRSATSRARSTVARRPQPAAVDESSQQRLARAGRILNVLRTRHPDADCALHHRSAYELLVATILSAQCTDERVNMVTPTLFARYPDPETLAPASQEDVETLIRSTGFFRNKAKNIVGMAKQVCATHDGEIPDSMEALLELPGVARKTANCVLGTWFRKNEGIVVDTHVGRLASRLGLLSTARDDKDAVRVEQDLMQLFPRESWTYLAHALIDHGRQVCKARQPDCPSCPLANDCPSAER